MSRRTPVYFDPTIPMADIIHALAPAGLTLKGDGHGHIMVIRRELGDRRRPALVTNNVVPMRRPQ